MNVFRKKSATCSSFCPWRGCYGEDWLFFKKLPLMWRFLLIFMLHSSLYLAFHKFYFILSQETTVLPARICKWNVRIQRTISLSEGQSVFVYIFCVFSVKEKCTKAGGDCLPHENCHVFIGSGWSTWCPCFSNSALINKESKKFSFSWNVHFSYPTILQSLRWLSALR